MMVRMVQKEQSKIDAISQLSGRTASVQAQVGRYLLAAATPCTQAARSEGIVQLSNICLVVLLLSRWFRWFQVSNVHEEILLGPSEPIQELEYRLPVFLQTRI
jgi:hypothetical protein